jgi:predicted 3-demethylubiquinone-9 3-methyltransferase (glyoxalase superfamily)
VSSKITPFLWFDDKAEAAMNFYVAIFKIPRPAASRATVKRVLAPRAA